MKSLFYLLLSYSQENVYIAFEEKKLNYWRDQAPHPDSKSLKRYCSLKRRKVRNQA